MPLKLYHVSKCEGQLRESTSFFTAAAQCRMFTVWASLASTEDKVEPRNSGEQSQSETSEETALQWAVTLWPPHQHSQANCQSCKELHLLHV